METMSPRAALTFAVVRERGELMDKRVSGGIIQEGQWTKICEKNFQQ